MGGQACSKTGQIAVSGQAPVDPYGYIVPSAAHSTGAAGTNWRSDVAAVNWTGDQATLHLAFYDYATGAASVATRVLAGSATVEWKDILVSVFGVSTSASVKGTLLIGSDQALAISSRTYNQENATRTYGQYYPALFVDYPGGHAEHAIATGDTGILAGLKKDAAYRTNVGIVNLSQAPCTITVQLINGTGDAVGSARAITAAARLWKQEDDIFTKTGAGNQEVAYARLTVPTSGCTAWAYASVIDQNTGDPTTIPILLR